MLTQVRREFGNREWLQCEVGEEPLAQGRGCRIGWGSGGQREESGQCPLGGR